ALALDRPVVPVSTLAALAMRARDLLPLAGERPLRASGQSAGAPPMHDILAAIDARMGEVYLGAFRREGDIVVAAGEETLAKPEAAPLPEGEGWLGVGTGFAAGDGALRRRLGERLAAL